MLEGVTAILKKNPGARDMSLEGVANSINIKIFVDGNGKILTSFPAWRQ